MCIVALSSEKGHFNNKGTSSKTLISEAIVFYVGGSEEWFKMKKGIFQKCNVFDVSVI